MKKCGLRRAFTFGGTPMDPAKKLAQMDEEDRLLRQFNITDQFRSDRQAGLQARADSISGTRGLSSRQKSSALGRLSEQAGAFGTSIDFDTPTGLSARQRMHLDLDTQSAQDRSSLFDMNRQQQIASTFGYQQGKSNDPGQDLLAKSAAIRAEMEAKYGGNVAAAGKPATPPPPKTGGTPPSDADIVKQELGNRPGYFRRAFAHGGAPAHEPFVDERGVIHGPEGSEKNPDKVKAKVKETGEPIMVGNKERIVNPEQAAAFDRHFASLGMTTDEFLEEATGEPVGPTLQRGLRHAANGMPPMSDMTNDQLREALRGQAGEAYRASLAPKPAAPVAAPTVPPAVMEHHTLPGRAAAPGAAPMMEPLSIPNQPAQPQGVGKAKAMGKQALDAARGAVSGTPAVAPSQATRPGMGVPGEGMLKGYGATPPGPPKWYQPSAGVRSLARIGPAVASGAERLAAPVALLAGAYDVGQGLQHQNTRDAEEIDRRGGFLASSFRDALPALATVGEKLGNDLGRVAAAVQGLDNHHTGKRESVWEALTSTDPAAQGETAGDIYRRNTGAGSLSETAEAKAARAKGEAEAKAKADADAKAKADADAKAKAAEVAVSPLRDPTTNKVADEANANVRGLRSAGVRGDLTGDVTVDGKTGARGIRTIQTMNGNVYAGRDKNGQLQVVSGLDRSPEDNEALRAKEAARMTADLTRQTRAFNDMSIASDLKSNSREDNRRGLMALAQRQMQEDSHNKGLDRALMQRGQDITLRGHELEYGAKSAALQNQMLQQNVERNAKTLDALLGGETVKVDGKDVANDKRQKVMTALTLTLGEAGRHLGHLTPKDLQEFMVAYDAAQDAEPGTASKIYRKWIEGRPWVEDYNPHRAIARAAGPEGQTGSLGMYQNPNGASVWQPAVVGQQFLTGEYSGPRQRLINQ